MCGIVFSVDFSYLQSNSPRSSIMLEEAGFYDSHDTEDPYLSFQWDEALYSLLKPCKR